MGVRVYIGDDLEKSIKKCGSNLNLSQFVRLAVLDKIDRYKKEVKK